MNEKPEPLTQAQLRDMFPLPETFDWFQNRGVSHITVYGICRLKIRSGGPHTSLWFGWVRAVDGHSADDVFAEPVRIDGWSVAFVDRDHCEVFPTAQEAYQRIYNRFLFDRPEGFQND